MVPQSGVAYVAHFHDTSLLSIRTDRATPEPGPTVDLGNPTRDMVLDDENNRLVVGDIAAPTTTGKISFATAPRIALINP